MRNRTWRIPVATGLVLVGGLIGAPLETAEGAETVAAPRWLCAAPTASGQVGLSWRRELNPIAQYKAYRNGAYLATVRSTSYVDREVVNGETYTYQVTACRGAVESRRSSPVRCTATDDAAQFCRAFKIPVEQYSWLRFGDLNGDGYLDYLLQNGWKYMRAYFYEPAKATVSPTPAWRHEMNSPHGWGHGSWRMEPQPTVIWDIDGDGDNEIVCVLYWSESEGGDNRHYVAILDAATGVVEQKTLFADGKRIAESLHPANLLAPFGRRQEIVVRTAGQEQLLPEVYTYDRNLKPLWEYRYASRLAGPQCHRIKAWDIDHDGYDEVLLGEVCLESDGEKRAREKWVCDASRNHQDSIAVAELDANQDNGMEVVVGYNAPGGRLQIIHGATGEATFYHSEEPEKGFFVRGSQCVHASEIGDFTPSHPGLEIAFHANRERDESMAPGESGQAVLCSVKGKTIWRTRAIYNPKQKRSNEFLALHWDGDEYLDILADRGVFSGDLTMLRDRSAEPMSRGGLPYMESCFLAGDVIGDYREEYFAWDPKERAIYVYTNADHNPVSKPSFWKDPKRLQYVLRNWVTFDDF